MTQTFYEDMELEAHEDGKRHVYRQRHASRMVFPQELRTLVASGRRLRAGRVVLRLQAAPQARPGPPPAPDGRRPAKALERPTLRGQAHSQARGRGEDSRGASRGSTGRRSPISRASPRPAKPSRWWTPAAAISARASTTRARRSAAAFSRRRDEAIDAEFFRRRLEAAWEYRRDGRPDLRRLSPLLERGRRAARDSWWTATAP